MESLILQNSHRLRARAKRLKRLEKKIEEPPKALNEEEMSHIMAEIQKISKLWRSRRERLKAGLWRKIGEKGKKKEEKGLVKEEQEENELERLNREKSRIEELIKQTKIKYRKREIDEESFRDIIKDYQKELMEINIKISELESSI
jgi:hypothetical protein